MNKVTASSLLLVLQKAAERSIGLVSTLILARLLSPADFGVIAIAMLLLWFVQTLTQAGTELYIIQKESVSDDEINSAWTLDLILKNCSFIVLFACAPMLAAYQNDSSLTSVVIAIGCVLPLAALKNPGLWLLKREQRYSSIVKVGVLIKLSTLLVTIPLAYYLKSFWAIVFGQITSALLSTLFSYRISMYRPKFNISNIAVQWRFSKWLIPQEILGYFRNHIDTLIVSSLFPAAGLGAYNNMKYFASIPMLQVMTPLVAPLHAELGKVQNNLGEMRFQSALTIKLMGFIVAPFATLSFVASEQIINVILGAQWVPYHLVFAYFGLMILPFVLLTQANRILMVKSHTRSIFKYELISTSVTASLLMFIPFTNIEKFALYRISLEFMLSTLFYFYANKRVFGILGFNNFLAVIVVALLSTFILYLIKTNLTQTWSDFWQLLILSAIVGFVVLMLLIIWYAVIASEREKRAVVKFSPIKNKVERAQDV